MNSFHLKIIASVTMLIDHMSAVMPAVFGQAHRVVGRIAFPIYVFLIAEGFRHSKNPWKFMLRLGAFAIISEPIFDFALGNDISFVRNTNIFYTLFLGGAAIIAYKYIIKYLDEKPGDSYFLTRQMVAISPAIPFMWIAEFLSTDYGAYGVIFILSMYVIKPKLFRLAVMAFFCVWQHRFTIQFFVENGLIYLNYNIYFVLMIPATLLAVVFVAFYNEKRGRDVKWFFYVFYPLHLGVLVLMREFVI